MKPYELTMAEAMEKMESGELSSVELTRSCLDRIAEVETQVQAFISHDEESAVAQAEQADKKRANGENGKLLGIPLALKDLLCTEGVRTTCGSDILGNFIPPYDATVVEKIKNEGGVVLGKLTMDEFAMGSTSETCKFGVPENPWREGYVAGGSSGGSAAASAGRFSRSATSSRP